MIQSKFQFCIEACRECTVICHQCAVACLHEKEVDHLRNCIQLNLECVALCDAAVKVMSLDGRFSRETCRVCRDICNACAEECEKHAAMGMDHCRECAETCRRCAAACEEMLVSAA
ncbi:MAG: four-helix bundle copper-binding protein [Leadbetterella sp.]|nr:four-helix bundle copper-binding protein [Leadbetterella sp.]